MRSTYPVAAPVPSAVALRGWSVPIEWLVYCVLIMAFIALRFAELDTAVMGDAEAAQAIIAWDTVYPRAAALPSVSAQPLTFYGQVLGLSMFGTGEMAARSVMAVAGIVLALLPLLFRNRIGRTQTLLMVLLWGLSPVALAASRTSDAAIWPAIFGVLILWSLGHFYEQRRMVDGLAVLVFACLQMLLSGPYGLVLVVILGLSLTLTVYLTALSAPLERDIPSEHIVADARDMVRELPFRRGIMLGVLIVVLISTGFLLQSDGLSMVGAGLESALRGITQPWPGTYLPIQALLVTVLYELGAVVLGVGGYILLQRHDRVSVSDRFAMIMILVAAIVSLLYRGAGPGFALFIVLPLGWLCARVVTTMLVDESTLTYWDLVSEEETQTEARYGWVKWMLALILVAILVMVGTHLQEVARTLLTFAPGLSVFDNLPRFFTFPSNGLRSLVWVVMSILFTVVGSFLVASIWGNRITLQSVTLGLFGFTVVSGIGGGWNAISARVDQPVEIWQSSYVQRDAYLLRDTLHEVALFTARNEPVLNIAVVEEPSIGLINDGAVAWLLREFRNTRYVATVAEANREEIIIMRRTLEEIDLGGSYVGQSFALRTHQQLLSVPVYDWLAWLAQRRTRVLAPQRDSVVMWVRLDLYNSVPVDLSARVR